MPSTRGGEGGEPAKAEGRRSTHTRAESFETESGVEEGKERTGRGKENRGEDVAVYIAEGKRTKNEDGEGKGGRGR